MSLRRRLERLRRQCRDVDRPGNCAMTIDISYVNLLGVPTFIVRATYVGSMGHDELARGTWLRPTLRAARREARARWPLGGQA